MTEESCFVNRQAVHQHGPFLLGGGIRHPLVVGLVVRTSQLPHPQAQIGGEEGSARGWNDHPGAPLQQVVPLGELPFVQIRKNPGFPGPVHAGSISLCAHQKPP